MLNEEYRFFNASETQRFTDRQRENFLSCLKSSDADTLVFPLDSVDQLALNSELCTVNGKAKLSHVAFKQICYLLSDTLFPFIADFAGFKSKSLGNAGYSHTDAGIVFNLVLKRRFDSCLADKKIVKRVSANVIDAVVGARHKSLSGIALIESVENILYDKFDGYSFKEACLCDREFLARYEHDATVDITVDFDFDINPVTTGLIVRHDEYHNRSYVSMYISFGEVGCVRFPVQTSWAIGNSKEVVDGSIENILSAVDSVRKIISTSFLDSYLNSCLSAKLGLTGTGLRDKIVVGNLNKLIENSNVSQEASDRIVKRALYSSVENGKLVLSKVDKEKIWPYKTAADVFVSSLIQSSETDNITAQDNIEQFSFKLLFGKVKV
jgi:hypothetical protein